MGKHERSYKRVERDLYPTPAWVIAALAEYVELHGTTAWEFACGDGRMTEALRAAGCTHVYASDIVDRGNGQDEVLDFLSAQIPKLVDFNLLVTNPPFGKGGRLATAFIEAGLRRLPIGGTLALLLPCDFDSGKTRSQFFGNCSDFVGKIVLRRRIKWFEHPGKATVTPKENSAWFLWSHSPLRIRRPPAILYAPTSDVASDASNELPRSFDHIAAMQMELPL
jgi:hypothetical protein